MTGYDDKKMKDPAISIVIPAYNAVDYLRRCLDSVAAQTFGDFELIVVDDCSTDNGETSRMVKEYAARDSRFRLIAHTQNSWQGEARNTGITAARGKYIAFLDSDDSFEPEMLEKLYFSAEHSGADVAVCGFFLDYGRHKEVYLKFQQEICGSGMNFLTSFFCDFTSKDSLNFPFVDFAVWNKLVRRELLISKEIRNLPGRVFGEDIYFTFLLLLHAKKVCCIPDVLYNYFQRNPASSNATGAAERLISTLTAYDAIRTVMLHVGLNNEDWQRRFYRFVGYQLFAGILRTVKLRPATAARDILQKLAHEIERLNFSQAIAVWPDGPPGKVLAAVPASIAGGAGFYRILWELRWRYFKRRYIPVWMSRSRPRNIITSPMPKRLLVIRPDQLGDFCLSLPYLAGLRALLPAAETELVLLGNLQWTALAEKCLNFDRIIPLDDKKFLSDRSYRRTLLKSLRRERFDMVIESRISRYVKLDDVCRIACRARRNFAFAYTRDQAYHFKIFVAQKFVDLFRVRTIAKPYVSELENNEFFWSELSGGQLPPKYDFSFDSAPSFPEAKTPYFVILPGAGKPYKEYPPEKFAEIIAKLLTAHTGLSCVVAGGPEHFAVGELLRNSAPGVVNACGKTSLWQFAGLLRDAKFVLGNDTGGIHLAALIGTPSVALAGGGGFKRFLPYPEKFARYLSLPHVVTGNICREGCTWICPKANNDEQPRPCIESVHMDDILNEIQKVFTELTNN